MEGIRNVDATFKYFVNPKACQFLVDYPLLVFVPSGLGRNLSFARGVIKKRTFPGRKTPSVGGIRSLHSSVGNKSIETVSGGIVSTTSGISESRSGVLAQISLRGGPSLPCSFPSPSRGIVSRGMLTRTFFVF